MTNSSTHEDGQFATDQLLLDLFVPEVDVQKILPVPCVLRVDSTAGV